MKKIEKYYYKTHLGKKVGFFLSEARTYGGEMTNISTSVELTPHL